MAVVHGVGSQKEDFAKAFASRLKARFSSNIERLVTDSESELQVRGVYWAKELADQERKLEERFHLVRLRWGESRNIMIDIGGDALAYQINRQVTPQAPPNTYEKIHMAFAGTLKALVADTDSEAPLCIVAHSLGSVIASNYIWDLQRAEVPNPVRDAMGHAALEEGKTHTSLYTMGSPIAVWSLRFPDFGVPIQFPAENLLPKPGSTDQARESTPDDA
ncbi:MAG: hypothetical protein LC808_31875 [Actinobacteria bacterium]|nr:hypothetical protein [Actinomycetota bacterium]